MKNSLLTQSWKYFPVKFKEKWVSKDVKNHLNTLKNKTYLKQTTHGRVTPKKLPGIRIAAHTINMSIFQIMKCLTL